jgi:hypothetical protein
MSSAMDAPVQGEITLALRRNRVNDAFEKGDVLVNKGD